MREFLGVFISYRILFAKFWGRFPIIPLALAGYEIIIANSALCVSLVIYYSISKARS